jgi:2-dehydro-3-deoxyphosphogalactonate aldolase
MTGTSRAARFEEAFSALPLIAILRGLTPPEAPAIATALHKAGFQLIEVPLNSPEPFESIRIIRDLLPPGVLVGAGTVTRIDDVRRLADIGADLVVMPHGDVEIIRAAVAAGMICTPGIATPTEAFAALAAGAAALKIFPAELIGPPIVKAMRAVLPKEVRLVPVGGITPTTMQPFRAAGVAGFGLGSALYKPGSSAEDVGDKARAFVNAWRALVST